MVGRAQVTEDADGVAGEDGGTEPGAVGVVVAALGCCASVQCGVVGAVVAACGWWVDQVGAGWRGAGATVGAGHQALTCVGVRVHAGGTHDVGDDVTLLQKAGVAVAVLVAVAMMGNLSELVGGGSVDRGGATYAADACRGFRSAASDAVDGVLTDAEFRARLVTVERDARNAPDDVSGAARSLLADVTAGRDSGGNVRALGDACRRLGL